MYGQHIFWVFPSSSSSISEVNIDPNGHVFLVLLHVAKELNSQLDQ
jgi:hypothetical protein